MAKNIFSTLTKIDNEISRLNSLVDAAKQQRIDEIIRLLKCAVRKFGQPISFEAVGKDGTITTHTMVRAIPCYMENDDEYTEEGEYSPISNSEWAWYYLEGDKLLCKHCDASDSVYEYSELDESLIRLRIRRYEYNELMTIRHLFSGNGDDPIWKQAKAYYTDTVMKAIEVTAECAKRGIKFALRRGNGTQVL